MDEFRGLLGSSAKEGGEVSGGLAGGVSMLDKSCCVPSHKSSPKLLFGLVLLSLLLLLILLLPMLLVGELQWFFRL